MSTKIFGIPVDGEEAAEEVVEEAAEEVVEEESEAES